MADKKISDLNAITGANTADGDLFVIVDTSANETKSITKAELFNQDITIGGNLTVQGTTITVDSASAQTVDLGDNDKIRLGDGDDLQIYHDGTDSYISNSTGSLKLSGNTDVTGTVTADGATIDDLIIDRVTSPVDYTELRKTTTGSNLSITTQESMYLHLDANNDQTNRSITIASDTSQPGQGKKLFVAQEGGDISFYEDTGTTAKFFWDASAESLYVGGTTGSGNNASGNIGITTEATTKLHVKGRYRGFGITNFDSTIAVDSDYPRIMFGNSEGSGAFALIGGSSADNSLSFYTTGTAAQNGTISLSERMRIDSSGNVGIGVTPSAWGGILSKALQVGNVVIAPNSGSVSAGYFGTNWYYDGTNFKYKESNYVGLYAQETGAHKFFTAPSGTAGNNITFTQAMTLDASGNLLVGTTDEDLGYTDGDDGVGIFPWGGVQIARDSNFELLYLNKLNNNGNFVTFKKDGGSVGSIGTGGRPYFVADNGTTGGGLYFATSILPTDRLGTPSNNTLDLGSSTHKFKDLYLSGGVYLGGTGAANHLDDYEEGTWTPTIGSGTTSVIEARYIKIGNQVHLIVEGQQFSDTTSATNISIGGLPFTPAHGGMGSFLSSYRDDTTAVTSYVSDTNNTVAFYHNSRTSTFDALDHDMFNNSSAQVYWSVTYFTA